MARRAGSAVHVEPFMGHVEPPHEGHWSDGECFVDLPETNLCRKLFNAPLHFSKSQANQEETCDEAIAFHEREEGGECMRERWRAFIGYALLVLSSDFLGNFTRLRFRYSTQSNGLRGRDDQCCLRGYGGLCRDAAPEP